MKKPYIISDKNFKSLKIKGQIKKILNKNKLKNSNITIVVGGDGFMLKTLKKSTKTKKIFYGINSGNYGFLMNKFSKNAFIENINKSKMVSISPLEMQVTNNNKSRKNKNTVYDFDNNHHINN